MLVMIGLDCAPPALVFDRVAAHMPCLSSLMARGTYGPLRSCIPPITMPAWACMLSGRDAGELGIYGFRDRIEGSRAMRVCTADDLHVERVWDRLGTAGLRSAALYVPPSWPPRPIHGELVSCLLTPGPDAVHSWPPELAAELTRFGPHTPDIERHGSSDQLFDDLHAAASQHFDVAEHLLRSRRPDLLAMVEMGTDRLHHALWPALDPTDPRHRPNAPEVRDARDFYAYLDARIGRLLDLAGRDATALVVSDHGARSLEGGVYVNEWLRREGWLVLREEPGAACGLDRAAVDWPRTRAWAEGGYYARVVLNTRDRFADGAVAPEDAPRHLEALAAALGSIGCPARVVRPREAFRSARGTPPDLMVFFGDLAMRALGEVGTGRVLVDAAEAGASRRGDGCNHDWDGLFVLAGPEVDRRGRVSGGVIHDAGATILSVLGQRAPHDWLGRDLRALS